MKKTVMATALLAMLPMAAQADLVFTVGAKASIWNVEPTGQLDDDVSVEKDGLNIDSENGQQLSVYFEHLVPVLPNVKIKQTSLELEGDGSLSASFADQTFNEDVTSTMDLSHTDLTLYWGLPLPVPFVDVRAAIKPSTVSSMKLKSLVGLSAPNSTSFAPLATCVIIDGMTARADCLGPYVLNGLTITTGTSNDA